MVRFQPAFIKTVSTKLITPSGTKICTLGSVNVNTGAPAAVLKIYDGQDATGTLYATIDASTKSSQFFGVQFANGIFLDLSGGAADCTIGWG